jgi:hypothetical protein
MQNHCLVPFASFSLRLLLPGHVTIQHHPCGHAAAVSALHATSHATPLPLTANPAYHSASVPIRDEREGSVRVGMSLWSTRKIQVKPIFSNDPLQQPPLSLHPLPPSQAFTIARDVVEANVKRPLSPFCSPFLPWPTTVVHTKHTVTPHHVAGLLSFPRAALLMLLLGMSIGPQTHAVFVCSSCIIHWSRSLCQ